MSTTFYSDADVGVTPAHYYPCNCADRHASDLAGRMVLDGHQPNAAELAALAAGALPECRWGCQGRGCHLRPEAPALHTGPNWTASNVGWVLEALGRTGAAADGECGFAAPAALLAEVEARLAAPVHDWRPQSFAGEADLRRRLELLRDFCAAAVAAGASRVYWA